MSIGIYKLSFNNTDKVYIGQSIHIEARYKEHLNSTKTPSNKSKLLNAIETYGICGYSILEECIPECLNDLEIAYISKFNSFKSGFNSTIGGTIGGGYGEDHPASSLKNEDYYCILWYLSQIPTYTIKEIAEILDVSESIVENISSGTNHNWLHSLYPELYEIVSTLNSSRRHYATETILSPIIILSPEGVQYQVTKVSSFCAKHDLHRGHFRGVLKGIVNNHKGWHLPSTILKKYPSVKSPKGEIFNIPFGEMRSFTITHNLSETLFRHLLQGKAKSHKGWKLCEA